MVYYVAAIAIVNLGLGYALAKYMGAGRPQLVTAQDESFDSDDHNHEAAE